MTIPSFNLSRFIIVTRATETDMVNLLQEADPDLGVRLIGNDRDYPVANITRVDELPLGIDTQFGKWFASTGIRVQYKDVARQVWYAGVFKGIELMRHGDVT